MKRKISLGILLAIIFVFVITSVIAWYKKDIGNNVVLNENLDSLDANYLYRNYFSSRPSFDSRPYFGNKNSSITMIAFIDPASEASKEFVSRIFPQLKVNFIDNGRIRFIVKYYLDLNDLNKDSERFKIYSYLECIRETDDSSFNEKYLELLKSSEQSKLIESQKTRNLQFKDCIETDNFENIKKDALEVQSFGMIGINPRFYIGINGNSNTALDGIPTITKINQTVRQYEIEIGK